MPDVERSICADCGSSMPMDEDWPSDERTPCSECGSRNRIIQGAGAVTQHLSVSADAILVRAWDGNSLTLFGVLYGIVVTLVGVVIAKASTVGLIVYAMVSLALLAILLLFFGQPVIGAMRWLIERGKRVPPWPLSRWF